MSKSKPELMIASWPERPVDIPSFTGDTCASYKLPLRMKDPSDKWLCNEECQAANDMGLYIWVDKEGTVSIDLRVIDLYSATVRELEVRLKLLKRLNAKAERAGFTFHNFHRNTTVYEQILKALDALGIRRAVEYHGISEPDTFNPAGIEAKRIADALDAKISRIRQLAA